MTFFGCTQLFFCTCIFTGVTDGKRQHRREIFLDHLDKAGAESQDIHHDVHTGDGAGDGGGHKAYD